MAQLSALCNPLGHFPMPRINRPPVNSPPTLEILLKSSTHGCKNSAKKHTRHTGKDGLSHHTTYNPETQEVHWRRTVTWDNKKAGVEMIICDKGEEPQWSPIFWQRIIWNGRVYWTNPPF